MPPRARCTDKAGKLAKLQGRERQGEILAAEAGVDKGLPAAFFSGPPRDLVHRMLEADRGSEAQSLHAIWSPMNLGSHLPRWPTASVTWVGQGLLRVKGPPSHLPAAS